MGLIKHGKVVSDSFTHVEDGAPLPSGDVTVSLARLQTESEALRGRSGKLGVRVPPDADADAVAKLLDDVDIVAVEFPVYTDGRGYTIARLLRDRHNYRGELRAVGDVLRDQLFYMKRCGFDAFDLKDGKDTEGALEAFAEFSVAYQGAADDPRPLFRRR